MYVRPTKTPGITVADQPSEAELRGLKKEGYTGVVNLRHDGEPEQPLSTSAEGTVIKSQGVDYLHYGVGGAPLSEEGVTSVCEFLDQHQGGKVLVHCRKGARAAAIVLIHEAKRHKWTADDALANARELGLELDGGLRALVENYLRTHPAGA